MVLLAAAAFAPRCSPIAVSMQHLDPYATFSAGVPPAAGHSKQLQREREVAVAEDRRGDASAAETSALWMPYDACNTVAEASSFLALERILLSQLASPSPSSRPQYVFFDLDECLVMPATPFIDGLPGSDALVRKLVLCGEAVHAALRRKMEEAVGWLRAGSQTPEHLL